MESIIVAGFSTKSQFFDITISININYIAVDSWTIHCNTIVSVSCILRYTAKEFIASFIDNQILLTVNKFISTGYPVIILVRGRSG